MAAPAAPTVLTVTVVTVSGTPVQLTPLSTPWPSGVGCANNIYRQADRTLVAWDPVYPVSFEPSESTCFAPLAVAWWSQPHTVATFMGLGPTFACPEAYYTAQTASVADNVQRIFCCPLWVTPVPITAAAAMVW
jgi:hypothetical protein